MDIIVVTLIILLIVALVYWYLDRKFSYWARKNVPFEPPSSWIFGSAKELFFGKETSAIVYDNIYRKFDGKPYCGFYEFHTPILLIRDPQLIHSVLVEKFNSFQINKLSVGINLQANELIAFNPFVSKGNSWKEQRSKVVSGLTANKLKVLDDIAEPILKDIDAYLKNNQEDVEAFDLATRFTGEMVTTFGWGISGDGFSEKSPVKQIFKMNHVLANKTIFYQYLFPSMSNWLKLKIQAKEFVDFFWDVTSQAIRIAENDTSQKTTFLQHLLRLREKMRQNGEDMSVREISAHMNTFYLDAYETTAKVISLNIQYLMMYPEVQQRLREEINNLTEEITIDSVNKLQYMDMVFSEIFRIFPILSHFGKVCTERCKLGDLDVDIGTYIIIPLYSLHFDEKYYPNPEKFNPDNFSEENKSKRQKCTYFNFGYGPRTCAGMKYAVANVKLFISFLLKNYEILPPSKHPANTIKYDPQIALFYMPKGKFYVTFKKLK